MYFAEANKLRFSLNYKALNLPKRSANDPYEYTLQFNDSYIQYLVNGSVNHTSQPTLWLIYKKYYGLENVECV